MTPSKFKPDQTANESFELAGLPALREGYQTDNGTMYVGAIEQLVESGEGRDLKGKVQLLFTSPPFPLNRKKKYGNKLGDTYLEWLSGLAPKLVDWLTPDGSIVMELGNAWEPGRPVMSTLAIRALLGFMEAADLRLCQQFVCHNPARLPSPAQWVNVERIRVKDSFTHVWWMSPVDRPKADNRNVLMPYSAAMKKLLATGRYNSGTRPSGHNIGESSFNHDRGGSIPPAVVQVWPSLDELAQGMATTNLFEISNTNSTDPYRQYCRDRDIDPHPAPMQSGLVEFFVNFLTDKEDLILDPFGGSNMTGAVAERLGRRWVAVEPKEHFVEASKGRFEAFRDEDANGA